MKILAYREVVRVRDFERDKTYAELVLREVRRNIARKLVDHLLQTDEIFEISQNPHRDEYIIEAQIVVEQRRVMVNFDLDILPEPTK